MQSCISLWEGGLSLADVTGTDLLAPPILAMMARAAALRGEAVFVIDDESGLLPASDWDISTRNGIPRAYRLSVSEAGGGKARTALAGEVIHLRIASDPHSPWHGQAPIKRANLTASLLHAVEDGLRNVFEDAPIGSQVVPFPESPDTDQTALGRSFRGKRGRVLMRESVNVSAAGGPAPNTDWKPQDLTPDLSKLMTKETWDAARASVLMVYGVLPGMVNPLATGPMVREGQRHLAQWMLQPIAKILETECSEKLGASITIDTMRPLQAFDGGGRARTFSAIVKGMAEAKAAGIGTADIEAALRLVDWD